MLTTVKMLQNVASANVFDVVNQVTILGGTDSVTVTIRLWQKDREERYIPEASSTLTVTFPKGDSVAEIPVSQDVIKSATAPFATDTSIWQVTLDGTTTPDEVDQVTSGGIVVTLTEPTNGVTTFFVPSVISKEVIPTK